MRYPRVPKKLWDYADDAIDLLLLFIGPVAIFLALPIAAIVFCFMVVNASDSDFDERLQREHVQEVREYDQMLRASCETADGKVVVLDKTASCLVDGVKLRDWEVVE